MSYSKPEMYLPDEVRGWLADDFRDLVGKTVAVTWSYESGSNTIAGLVEDVASGPVTDVNVDDGNEVRITFADGSTAAWNQQKDWTTIAVAPQQPTAGPPIRTKIGGTDLTMRGNVGTPGKAYIELNGVWLDAHGNKVPPPEQP